AELLIDHAWGWEPCTIADIKSYKPQSSSLSAGQVLMRPYTKQEAATIVREMADAMVLDLVDKRLVTDQMVLTISYDRENLMDPERRRAYKGPVTSDWYGRPVPKHAHGTANLKGYTSSTQEIVSAIMDLYERIVDDNLLVRRIGVVASHVQTEEDFRASEAAAAAEPEQLDFFTDYEAREQQRSEEAETRAEERAMQEAVLAIQKKFGKNSLVKGMDLKEEATGMDRNKQIGGHKA
ncbi:MAG: DNA methylase, partial [Eubacterium sp.]|nr:DNA methylase [Eubacterium sp.]